MVKKNVSTIIMILLLAYGETEKACVMSSLKNVSTVIMILLLAYVHFSENQMRDWQWRKRKKNAQPIYMYVLR
jgi:hypothetical protein